MCGRFTLRTPAAEVARHFGLQRPLPIEPRYNIAPSQPVAVVIADQDTGTWEMVWMRWGLVPRWSRKSQAPRRIINTRSETVTRQGWLRESLARRRCLIPADGFYEWQHTAEGKQPLLIELDRGALFAMAGLWDFPPPEEEGEARLPQCTILTVPARGPVARVHDRMPLVLPPESYPQWLSTGPEQLDRLEPLLADGVEPSRWRLRPVSRAVNSPGNEGPQLLQPEGTPLLPGLEP